MAIELHLFGRPRALVDGQWHDLPFERRHQLLAYLSMKRTWIGRAELAGMLWPGVASRLAYANLRKTLFRLQLRAWAPAVEARADALRFQANTDVMQFEAAVRDGRIDDALAFRAHDLLPGYEDETSESWLEWLRFERERLRAAWRAAALSRLEAGIDAAEAVAITARLLEADPIDEDAVRAHMTWLARAGQVGEARRVYRDFVARLERDFGLAPGAQLQALHGSLASGSPTRAAAPGPAPDEGFIGRVQELRQIGETLATSECRLLCIVGPGGIGKTRLAHRVQREFGGRYADGSAFVALESVESAAEVAAAMARELAVAVPAGGDPLDRVIEHLHEREALLVLDNFEHVADAAPQVQHLLDECPRLQLLVTSRVRLGLRSEWLLPLAGLPCPDPEDRDRLDAFDAARLFLRSARRVEPAFAPAAEADAVIAICHEVEGLPLALELAATWTRVLSCESIVQELRQGTALLRAQDPAWPARHGSMDVVFEQSWAMLAPAERDALARLAVFRGGFTADAASRVARASLPILALLVDKSLLRKEGQRLFQHPLIQQLSALRLDGAARGETEAGHARYYHTLLEQLQGPLDLGDREALARIDVEFENCRAAWQWSTEHGDSAGLTRSGAALRNYCDHRARLREARDLFTAALDAAPPGVAAAKLRVDLARIQYRFGNHAEAIAVAQQALAGLHESSERLLRMLAWAVIGCAHLAKGRFAPAERAFRDGLELAQPEDVRMSAVLLGNLAWVEKHMGRFRDAIEMSLDALERFRTAGYAAAEAVCLSNLGELHIDLAEYDAAKPYLAAALQLAERHGFVATRMLVLTNLADASFRTGDLPAGRRHARDALEIAQVTGQRSAESSIRLQLVRAALRERSLPEARAELHRAARLANQAGEPALQIETAILFGELLALEGDVPSAAAVLRLAATQEAAAAHRARIDALFGDWRVAEGPPAPSVSFAELAERIASEAALDHAPLIASLRAH